MNHKCTKQEQFDVAIGDKLEFFDQIQMKPVNGFAIILGNDYADNYEYTRISYCPFCGEKL